MITTERMSDEFIKFHLDVGKFRIMLHHFTGAVDLFPHDHPYSFTTTILAGGYVEEIWEKKIDGSWGSYTIERKPGTSHRVEATAIHRIIELPQGECVTAVIWHDEVPRRDTLFWDFNTNPPISRPTHH